MMDYVSTNSFTHLQSSTGVIETVAANHSYELYAGIFGVNVKFWHVETGIFAEKSFCDEVKVSNRTITFCAVGAHCQNSIIKHHIGVFTCGSRCLFIYTQHR